MDYLVQGIRQGFRLGFGYSEVQLRSASRNMRSAKDNAEVVEQYLVKECGLGRVIRDHWRWMIAHMSVSSQLFRSLINQGSDG